MNIELKVVHDERATASEITRAASSAIRRTIFGIQSRILLSFAAPKSGKEYRRGRRTHQASAKGEAPGIDTGFLAGVVAAGASFPSPTTGQLDINAEYAEILEEVLDRPYIAPAIDGALAELERGGLLTRLNV